ncbi:hypothetical protein GCM10007973_11700 [Polymorphobacter multimanifer]|uniref:Phage shock protein B n=1 Tax=Polymorphobacter multimanifer TaxID=1070431 RepID=A0A841L8I0_9SPHN|nr:hypothetical protein [Polymorphobacter multimanifer]MBB6227273.1 hypothetical protein [Polymorphobacter multimanifer]GGI76481.1 hypothetical protein GCM10007973_11700 [Polymorphobacter multimanifer]
MSVYTMVVFIVLIVTIGRIYQSRQKLALKNPPPAPDTAEARRLQSEVARLNERIQVLERLATDPAKRLSDEIDGLKSLPHKPAAPAQETDNAQR